VDTTNTFIWYLFNEGAGNYLAISPKKLSDPDTTTPGILFIDPWLNEYLYVAAIPQRGVPESMDFPKHPRQCNTWSVGPDESCDSCNWPTLTWLFGDHTDNQPIVGNDHVGGDPDHDDDIQN